MNALQTFKFNDHSLTAYEHEDGTPLFSIQQVAGAIGYRNTRSLGDLLRKSPEFREGADYFVLEPSGLNPLGLSKHTTSLTFLTLDCARIVAMRSDKPNAALFRRWIVDVVFPAFEGEQVPARVGDNYVNLDVVVNMVAEHATDIRALRGDLLRMVAVCEQNSIAVASIAAALPRLLTDTRATAAEQLPTVPPKHTTGRALAAMYGVDVGDINRAASKLRNIYDGVFGLRCQDARFSRGVFAYSPSEAAEVVRFLSIAKPNPLGPVGEVFAK